jgi:6-phosphogluconolactonase
VYADARLLARAAAARLVTALTDAQAGGRLASLVLTGGGIGTQVLASVAASPARDAVDWPRLEIWWGDERFVPAGDPDRNETGAWSALLKHVPVDPALVHAMPGPDGRQHGASPEAAAERYADWLRAAAQGAGQRREATERAAGVPSFDVLLLGIGPEAHVASLFPGQPGTGERQRPVVAVHDSPKPPPTRLSLTFPAIQAARSVWILAAGAEKAGAVRLALAPGADPMQVPAAGARGREQTLFLLDRAAAADLES